MTLTNNDGTRHRFQMQLTGPGCLRAIRSDSASEVKENMKTLFVVIVLFMMGCVGIPENVKPVDHFHMEKYLGKWYEVARLDHSFERGLIRVTAEYSLRDDGAVRVINRGYSSKEGSWKEIEGKAYFVGGPDQGYLKVSFLGPFYGSYIIFELDHENYQYSLVSGPTKSYLWILSREPRIEEHLQQTLIAKASAAGFDTSKLIFVDQE